MIFGQWMHLHLGAKVDFREFVGMPWVLAVRMDKGVASNKDNAFHQLTLCVYFSSRRRTARPWILSATVCIWLRGVGMLLWLRGVGMLLED
jgi:hypothetical protein